MLELLKLAIEHHYLWELSVARLSNPYNLDDDDDAILSGVLSQGLIWIEDDEDATTTMSLKSKDKSVKEIKVHTLKGHTNAVNRIAVSGDFSNLCIV